MEVRDHGSPTAEDRDWKRAKSCMLILGGFHTMTDTPRAAGPRSGESTNASAGLATAPQPRGLVHRVYGKQIVHADGIDVGQSSPQGPRMLKSRRCDMLTDPAQAGSP